MGPRCAERRHHYRLVRLFIHARRHLIDEHGSEAFGLALLTKLLRELLQHPHTARVVQTAPGVTEMEGH
jgi:hypothetical protein